MLRRRNVLLALAVTGLGLVACTTSGTQNGFDDAKPSGTSSSGGTSGTSPSAGFGGGDDAAAASSQDGCSEEAKLVYVLSLEGDLYSFAPAAKKFSTSTRQPRHRRRRRRTCRATVLPTAASTLRT